MLAGTHYSGIIVVRVESQVLMKCMRVLLHGKSTLNVKQSVQDMDQKKTNDLSVRTLTDQTKISGSAIGKTLAVWKLREMLVGTLSSGIILVMVQS